MHRRQSTSKSKEANGYPELSELPLWYVTRSCTMQATTAAAATAQEQKEQNRGEEEEHNDIDDNRIRKEKHIKFCRLPYHEHKNVQHIRFNCSVRSFQFNSDAPPNAHRATAKIIISMKFYVHFSS